MGIPFDKKTPVKRITSDDIKKSEFLKFPKFLLTEKYHKLSNDSKMLYMFLRDRLDLSIVNNWSNKDGEVYIIYTREDMTKHLNKSKNVITKLCKELMTIGLISEQKRGLNKPNHIFFGTPTITNDKGIHKTGNQGSSKLGGNKTYANKTYKDINTLSGESANMSDSGQQYINNNKCKGNSKNITGDFVRCDELTDVFIYLFSETFCIPPHIQNYDGVRWNEHTVEFFKYDIATVCSLIDEMIYDLPKEKCNINYISKTLFIK